MTIRVELTRTEETALVSAIAATYPAAAALKKVKLEDGQIRARIDSPVGDLDVILELQVTSG